MTKFTIPKVDLDFELCKRRNISLARPAVLSVLVSGNPLYQKKILERLHPEHFSKMFDRFLFENMVDMIRNQGQVDVEELRRRIPFFAPDNPEFIEGCLANYAQILSFNPTPEQVECALDILTSPPRKYRVSSKKQGDNH
jgi:hypothetical protein